MNAPDLPERAAPTPFVSVIMANYNGAAHLADAIRSAQSQSLRNLEIIVSDDSSSDDSIAIVNKLMAEDPRIRLVRACRNGGPAAARNRALALTQGEWVAIMDSDDLMHPNRLTTLVEVARHDNADIVADNLVEFNTKGSKPLRPLLAGRWARQPFWVEICRYIRLNDLYGPGPALGYLKPLFRKSILTGPIGYYDESLKIGEDYDLVLRLLCAGKQMRVYPLPLYFYRRHSASASHRLNERALEALRAADERFLKQVSNADQPLADAVKGRMRSIETALAFEKLLNALKARNWLAAIRIALRKPRAAALLRFPLGVRLRRLVPSRGARIATAHLRVLEPHDGKQTSLRHQMENAMQSEPIALTICICTFRRPSILSAIDSVAKQTVPPSISVRILIIDNDAEQSAFSIVTEFRSRTTIRLDYKHVPGQNISMARNAGLDAATTPWLVFMDDDEFASTNWLSGLIASRNGANAVFGPCEAIYGEGTPDWIKQGDYHSNRITETEPITTGYTSNVLIDMAFVRRHGLRFAPELGRTGGEDTMFFHAMYLKGGVLKYASSAVVYETVVSSRLNLAWILRRRYRAGQVRALVSHRCDLVEYARLSLTAPFKVVLCVIMSGLLIPSEARAIWWLMRGVFHWGTISYALGIRVHEEYGKSLELT